MEEPNLYLIIYNQHRTTRKLQPWPWLVGTSYIVRHETIGPLVKDLTGYKNARRFFEHFHFEMKNEMFDDGLAFS